jgi:hypothetical protein
MSITTIHDLCEMLKKIDEVTLMELLHLRSEDIVDRFEDVIIRKSHELREELQETTDEEEEHSEN